MSTSQKTAVAALSVASNAFLVAAKLFIGLLIGSVSVISEAIHSGVDLAAAIIALLAVRKSGAVADEGHPYGHGKIENVSGVTEAILIFIAAIWIIVEAVKKLIHNEPLEAVGWGIGVMLVSSVMNWIVSARLFKIGRQTESAALIADGWHLRTDVYTSIGVMVGLGIVEAGKYVFPGANLNWVDPVAAILVACLILKAAYDLTVEAGKDLLDARLPKNEEDRILELVTSVSPKIQGIHKLRTRKGGHIRFADMHVLVDGDMSVKEAHRLTHQIANRLNEAMSGTITTVHVEPWPESASKGGQGGTPGEPVRPGSAEKGST